MISMRSYMLIACCCCGVTARSQNPTLTITSANIAQEIAVNNNSFNANSCLLGLLGYVRVRANADFSPTMTPSALSKLKLVVSAIGGVNLLGGTTERSLSITDQTLYAALASLGTGGPVTIRYRIPQAEMINYAWKAGNYTTGLTFTTPGGSLCLGSATFPATLTLVVQPFIQAVTASGIVINIDQLNYYRTLTVSASHNLPLTHTVPVGLRLKTSAAVFNYTNGYLNALNPNTQTSRVSARISAPGAGNPISLNAEFQNLSPTGGYAVPVGNKQTQTVSFQIIPADLRAGFLQKGTYTATLNYDAFDARTVPAAASVSQSPALTVNVADMGELKVNQNDVTLNFDELADFQNGVSVELSNALTVSKTTAYDVYVRANAANLVNGSNTIPVSVISIGPRGGESGITPVVLSTTPQKIIAAAPPVLDRQVGLTYRVPSDKVAQLLGKTPGTYSTVVTYSFTAP